MTSVMVRLDAETLERAKSCGPIDQVVRRALDHEFGDETRRMRRRWAEDNALLVEAIAGGAEEQRPL